MDRNGLLSCVLRCWFGILLFHLCRDVYGVKVLNLNVLSQTNQTNHTYVFIKKDAVATCDFELEEESEQLKSVHWSLKKEAKFNEFYVWKKEQRPSISGIFKGHIDKKIRDPHKLVITSAETEMHGHIKCEVKTSAGSDSKETPLVIIANTCTDDMWEFNLNAEKCSETIHFTCKGFYPKPTTSCGLYDRIAQKYIESFPLDSITKRDNLFDMSVTRVFEAKKYIENEDVALRCDIVIYGADYKFGIEKDMFGEKGCPKIYESQDLEINTTAVNETCWLNPANGSMITFQCDDKNPVKTITCINGNWMDESYSIVSDPDCNGSPGTYGMHFVVLVLLYEALIFLIW